MNLKIRATFFVTSAWANEYPQKVVELSSYHEIASHACSHSTFTDADYLSSKLELEKITKKKITGFRKPRLGSVNHAKLKMAGYKYDASSNPTWVPGRYNKITDPIIPFFKEGLVILPSSVTPFLRIPLFWLSFKNFPNIINLFITKCVMQNNVIVFYLHPWEFAEIGDFKLPFYINKICGDILTKKFNRFLNKIKDDVDFIDCNEYSELIISDGNVNNKH
ncbi:MAG: polysaccharide deacetylase family protein [Bacteroidetes bacterium]|nr:polysaccharide deacetylase family protein [Bacteroidota bacterium]